MHQRYYARQFWLITAATIFLLSLQSTGKSAVPMLLLYGADQSWQEKTVLLAAASPVKVKTGMMKRCHSIAQGKPNHYRPTGSHVWYAQFANGKLRNSAGYWVTWTGTLTSEQGAYPAPYLEIVTWTVPSGKEYYEENSICIEL